MRNKEKGITLIALVITIIVLLILAGVTLNLTIGENGIFTVAKRAALEQKKQTYFEEIKLEIFEEQTKRVIEPTTELFIVSIEKSIKTKAWVKDVLMCDESGIEKAPEASKMLIVETIEGYEIIIDIDNIKETGIIRENYFEKVGKKITVRYDGNGGTGEVASQEIRKGSSIILPLNGFTKTGYAFVGWNTDKENKDNKAMQPGSEYKSIEENTTLYAIWSVDTVTIQFEANGGQGTMANITVQKGSTVEALPESSYIKDGYTFIGWKDEEENEYEDKARIENIDKDIVLTAKWEFNVKEELSYLITTGNQYIDTGIIPNENTSLEIQYQLLSRRNVAIYGTRVKASDNAFVCWYAEKYGGIAPQYGNESGVFYSITDYAEVYTLRQSKNKFYINDTLKKTFSESNFSKLNTTLLLFSTRSGADIADNDCAEIKFYYCKMWDGDILIRDFIPVIDRNNKICLYDKVNSKLYYAESQKQLEEFKAPSDIIELKSVITNGKQYIDKGIIPNQDTSIELKFKVNSDSQDSTLFGSRNKDTNGTKNAYIGWYVTTSNRIDVDYNNGKITSNGYSTQTIYTLKQEKNELYVNNVLKGRGAYSSFTGASNLFLFAGANNGTISGHSYITAYYCKIWDGSTLVRDFIPVINSQNIVSLYDKVNDTYYYSDGQEHFEIGDD